MKKGNEIIRAQRKVNLKVSRAESLTLNVVFCGKWHLTIRYYKNPDRKQAYWTVRKSLAEVREVTLITAARISKGRRLSLKKVKIVEVVVIHVVAVEVLFAEVAGPTVYHVVADIT